MTKNVKQYCPFKRRLTVVLFGFGFAITLLGVLAFGDPQWNKGIFIFQAYYYPGVQPLPPSRVIGVYQEYEGYRTGQIPTNTNDYTGSWRSWYANGKLRLEGQYRNGDLTGLWKAYDQNGNLVYVCNYENNTTYTCVHFDESGNKVYEIAYKQGVRVVKIEGQIP